MKLNCRLFPDKYDGSVHTVDDFFRLNVAALEQMVRDPETQVSGVTVIVDLNGFGLQHASFLTPYYVKNTTEVVQVRGLCCHSTVSPRVAGGLKTLRS